MTLYELSKTVTESLDICLHDGINAKDVKVLVADFHSGEVLPIPCVQLRKGEDFFGENRLILTFNINED